MNPEEEIPPEVAHRAYYRQPVWKRIVVIGAGPAVNIALGLAILFVLTLTNAVVFNQSVGEVMPKTPAEGVLKVGDKVVAVDGSSYAKLGPEERVERFHDESGPVIAHGKQVDGCLAHDPGRADDRT